MGHFDDGPKKIVFEIIQARVYIFDAVPELKSLILKSTRSHILINIRYWENSSSRSTPVKWVKRRPYNKTLSDISDISTQT